MKDFTIYFNSPLFTVGTGAVVVDGRVGVDVEEVAAHLVRHGEEGDLSVERCCRRKRFKIPISKNEIPTSVTFYQFPSFGKT